MEYAQRSVNQFADALATLGSQVLFKKESTLIRVIKQQSSIIETLKKIFLKHGGSIKDLKDYTLIEGELYRRLLGGILSRCVSKKEGKNRLEELHS